MENTLYYGDNLDILKRYIADESVDLVYLDPPFGSNVTYNVLFAEHNGTQAAAQLKAFGDTWHWDQVAAQAYQEIVEAGGKVSQAMQAFRQFLGDSDMLAYLAMMTPRLVELRRVLKPIGSLYLHCDPTASHYLKMLMDAVFGAKNFRNEIIWRYRRWPAKQKNFQRMHDIVLRYTKRGEWTWNQLYDELSPSSIKQWKGKRRIDVVSESGRRHSEIGVKKSPGVPMNDVWEISQLTAPWKEYLGYPTQKPEALLERIIKASSNEGDIVLDPFCGCGTTIAVAQRLKRRWTGIDITHLAITLIKHRLKDAFGDKAKYQVIGEPVSLPDAEDLAQQDPYQFQWWALGLVGARPVEQKKGADKGIDGRIYFHDEAVGGKTKQVILSVKAGHTNVAHIRDLRGVVEREKADIGVLIMMQAPTQPMRSEAASAGFYAGWGKKYPKLQILTVEDLLNRKKIDMPPLGEVSVTFKKAQRARPKEEEHPELGDWEDEHR